jgi:hypothetical protein|nr:NUDIX hydrolase [uncultured Lachnoanaerobaculum sp.]
MSREKELWDIYDENKLPTGETIDRYNFSLNPKQFHLVVIAILFTNDKKVLITRRSPDKRYAGGLWEIPGGGVRAGENSQDAVRREILEETGINLYDRDYEKLYTYKRINTESNSYFVDMYSYIISEDDVRNIKMQVEEVSDFKILSVPKIKEIAKRGEFLHFDNVKEVLYNL